MADANTGTDDAAVNARLKGLVKEAVAEYFTEETKRRTDAAAAEAAKKPKGLLQQLFGEQ